MAATETQNHQHEEHGRDERSQGGAAPAPASPGLDAVKHAAASAEADPKQIVGILRSYPSERDAIMTWLHQHRGNAFVQQVTAQMGQIEAAVPGNVDVQSVRASLSIPGHRKLAGGYFDGYTVRTQQATQVGVEVTHAGLRVWMSPGMFIDADWPLQDCELGGASLTFGKNEPHVDVRDMHGLGTGMISIAGRVQSRVSTMIQQAVGHTKLVAGKYDPMQDQDLAGTLDSVMRGFQGLFADEDSKGKKAEGAPVAPEEMTRVSAGATVAMRAPQLFAQGGSGLSIAGGAPINIDVDGAGNVKGLTDAAGTGDKQKAADAASVQAIHISSAGLEIQAKGKPIARIEELTLSRGGKVTIDRMTPLGKLADAQAMESGISLLAALVALHGGSSSAGDLYNNAQRPQVVDGLSRGMIEKEFTDMVHKMVLDYRHVVPGLDLAKSLGIQ